MSQDFEITENNKSRVRSPGVLILPTRRDRSSQHWLLRIVIHRNLHALEPNSSSIPFHECNEETDNGSTVPSYGQYRAGPGSAIGTRTVRTLAPPDSRAGSAYTSLSFRHA